MIDWQNATVWILGLGESGLAMAQWVARQGARSVVTDTREHPPMAEALSAQVPQARYLPASAAADFTDFTHVALSPGLSPRETPIADWLQRAAAQGAPVWGEIEWFMQALKALAAAEDYQPTVLGVTGTNGKTTVARLTGHLLSHANNRVQVTGNLHPSALTALMAALDQAANQTIDPVATQATDPIVASLSTRLPEVWVLELSSFQLAAVEHLPLTAAVWLNLTQDHLDWHGDLQAYREAKARLFKAAKTRIVNRDDAVVLQAAGVVADCAVRSFGSTEPLHAGDLGLCTEQGMLWLVEAQATTDTTLHGNSRRALRARQTRPAAQALCRLMPAEALRIKGPHNLLNAQAALLLARAAGVDWAPLLHGLRSYVGESHRLQWLRTVQGVDYIDDSKGTNVGATVAALKSTTGKVILIAGGEGKNQDFSPLLAAVEPDVKAIFLIGRDAERLAKVLQPAGVPITQCTSLEIAVQAAASVAQTGETVLLSPACASLDMFRDYRHRGEVYADAVRAVALSVGEVA